MKITRNYDHDCIALQDIRATQTEEVYFTAFREFVRRYHPAPIVAREMLRSHDAIAPISSRRVLEILSAQDTRLALAGLRR